MAKRGRPKRDNWAALFRDVRVAMRIDGLRRGKGCSIQRACRLLATGKIPPPPPGLLADGTWVTLPQTFKRWEGRKWRTLRQRYYEFERELK